MTLRWTLLALALAAPAAAQEAEVATTRIEATRVDDVVALSGSYLETSSCETFGGIRAGTPEGAVAIAGAMPATIRVDHSGADVCAVVATERPYAIVLPGDGAANVALYLETRIAGGQRRVTVQIVPIADP